MRPTQARQRPRDHYAAVRVPWCGVPADPQCFSVRRLSPFRGTLHMIKCADDRAVTADGVNWQIQLWLPFRTTEWGRTGADSVSWRYLVAGVWNRDMGFERFPLDPAMDVAQVESAAERLLQQIGLHAGKLPFAPDDNLELWLLDRDQRVPLALLASTGDADNCSRIKEARWVATTPGDLSFVSDTLSQDPAFARSLDRASPHHRDALAALVRDTAGRPPVGQWFERDSRGNGRGLTGVGLDASLVGRRLPRERFPEVPLRQHWPDPRAQSLVHDYLAWLAPRLLTLFGLSPVSRAFWESVAGPRAEEVARLHRLYPQVVDDQLVTKSRVEAALRRVGG